MERIQVALERARAKRGTVAKPADKANARPATPIKGSANLVEAWKAIKVFEPDPQLLAANRIPAYERNQLSTPIDMLRTKVLQMMRDNGWNRLAVTSPNAACGKTTLSLSLAFSIARQPEQRVAVIEMDLRRPNVAATLGMPRGTSQFANALEGRAPIEEHLVRISENILVGANHGSARHPSELLQSDTMRTALDEVERVYQPTIMIFDMPPTLVSDDMVGFADTVDCALLVAAAESTSISEVDNCERDISERTNVLGVVLNKCRYMGKEYGYDYYS
ncbi:chromosome partitioning protein [Roseobacter cerasinus]|uniref:Chromosome partitioning protein n=1 Tax=Roseobacter cerasinus TaxID=2602289 RepID=A0A640VYN4_9RHOB|nr:CpsD/CapB family tyrosine-protein kinase [Roseobacter cerasinus]GFE52500.1 chromosome partitioning protein [Roseobacter cerasinus]